MPGESIDDFLCWSPSWFSASLQPGGLVMHPAYGNTEIVFKFPAMPVDAWLWRCDGPCLFQPYGGDHFDLTWAKLKSVCIVPQDFAGRPFAGYSRRIAGVVFAAAMKGRKI